MGNPWEYTHGRNKVCQWATNKEVFTPWTAKWIIAHTEANVELAEDIFFWEPV